MHLNIVVLSPPPPRRKKKKKQDHTSGIFVKILGVFFFLIFFILNFHKCSEMYNNETDGVPEIYQNLDYWGQFPKLHSTESW